MSTIQGGTVITITTPNGATVEVDPAELTACFNGRPSNALPEHDPALDDENGVPGTLPMLRFTYNGEANDTYALVVEDNQMLVGILTLHGLQKAEWTWIGFQYEAGEWTPLPRAFSNEEDFSETLEKAREALKRLSQ